MWVAWFTILGFLKFLGLLTRHRFEFVCCRGVAVFVFFVLSSSLTLTFFLRCDFFVSLCVRPQISTFNPNAQRSVHRKLLFLLVGILLCGMADLPLLPFHLSLSPSSLPFLPSPLFLSSSLFFHVPFSSSSSSSFLPFISSLLSFFFSHLLSFRFVFSFRLQMLDGFICAWINSATRVLLFCFCSRSRSVKVVRTGEEREKRERRREKRERRKEHKKKGNRREVKEPRGEEPRGCEPIDIYRAEIGAEHLFFNLFFSFVAFFFCFTVHNCIFGHDPNSGEVHYSFDWLVTWGPLGTTWNTHLLHGVLHRYTHSPRYVG